MSEFIYLLNSFEAASQSNDPSENGYREKRCAVIDYVAAKESELTAATAALEVESGLLDEAILFLHTIGCGLLPWATGQDMMSNFHDKLISVRAAAAKGEEGGK